MLAREVSPQQLTKGPKVQKPGKWYSQILQMKPCTLGWRGMHPAAHRGAQELSVMELGSRGLSLEQCHHGVQKLAAREGEVVVSAAEAMYLMGSGAGSQEVDILRSAGLWMRQHDFGRIGCRVQGSVQGQPGWW